MSVQAVRRDGKPTKYEVRWREAGQHRARTFARKSDANAWDREVQRRIALGPIAVQHLTTRGQTLTDWVIERWTPEHAAQLEDSTRATYAHDYARHIEPWLGHLNLLDLTVGRLREWQADRLANGVSPSAMQKARTVLSSILRHAAESEAIPGNPVALVRAPKLPHKDEAKPLTPAQVEAIRSHLDPRGRLIVAVLAYSGMRPGELRALRWEDIRERTILVERAAKPKAGEVKSVKGSRKARAVRLLDPLREDLDAHRAAVGARSRHHVLVNIDGGPWSQAAWANWREDWWRPACKAAGIDPVPVPYILRHSFASLLLAEGRSVHEVAKQLGHAAEMTLRIYGHVIDEYAGLDDPPKAVEQIRKARAHVQPPPAKRVPQRTADQLQRAELDELLAAQLAAGPDGLTSTAHRRRLAEEHDLAVSGERITKAFKRLQAAGRAELTTAYDESRHIALAWNRTPTTLTTTQETTDEDA